MFAGGNIWGWVVGLPYLALVALEVSGRESWRITATPYLDIAIVVGLTAIGWRMNRRPDPREARLRARAARAALKANPAAMKQAQEEGLIDDGPPGDDLADAGPESIVARPRRGPGLGSLIARVFLTLLFVVFMFILLVAIGLAVVRWAKAWWYIVVPAMALLAGLLTWWIRGMLREGKEAEADAGKSPSR